MSKFSAIENGSGQPMVFLHGIASNAGSFDYQQAAFSETHRTIALNLPGYGDSAPLVETTFPKLAAWLGETLSALQADSPILVGHSYGGMIVQEYLAQSHDPVSAVILYGTSPAFGKPDGEWQQAYVRARLEPLDQGSTMADLAPKITQGLVGSNATAEGMAHIQKGIEATSETAFRTAVQTLVTFEQRANLPNISAPCLCIVGEEDSSAPPKVSEKMASKIPGSSYVCLPRLGHMAHIEDPEAFNAALTRFLT